MDIEKRNKIISIALWVVIIVLGYSLYRSFVGPWERRMAERAMTEKVRLQMSNIRDGLIAFQSTNRRFPKTLDTLIIFLKTDPKMVEKGADVFAKHATGRYFPDSLLYSPRPPHNKFSYTLNDTLRPNIYLLIDPDNEKNRIGSLERTTQLNAASWE